MGKRHTNQTVHHDRDGSKASGDMEGPKSDAEKSRGGKGMKDEKKDRESGSDSMRIHNFTRHAGMGGMGDRANRTRANRTRANSMHIHNFTRHAGMGGMGDRANRTR